jgi:hypothetical protein
VIFFGTNQATYPILTIPSSSSTFSRVPLATNAYIVLLMRDRILWKLAGRMRKIFGDKVRFLKTRPKRALQATAERAEELDNLAVRMSVMV